MHRYALAGAMALGLAFVGCDKVTDNQEVFQSFLNGANEAPTPRATAATGTAQYVVDGDTIFYTVELNNISNVNAGHIHTGGAGVAGGVIVFLIDPTPPATGARAPLPNFTSTTGNAIIVEGTITRSTPLAQGFTYDSLVAAMRAGTVYTNFHTAQFPAGEIRGQVNPVNID
jgi:CHRD domain-containing protein